MSVRIGRLAAALVALLGAALVLAACGGSGGGGTTNAVLRVGTLGDIDSLNPFVALATQSGEITVLTQPTLTTYDNAGRIQPSLARSWRISADGKSATFTLAPGRWSDGKPITADDVVWTVNTIVKFAKGPTANLASFAPSVTGASSSGSESVTLTFSTPAANALGQLTLLPIVPRHVWERYAKGDGRGLQSNPDSPPIVGGGPFSVSSYHKGQQLTLDRNPGYYGPAPHVARIGFAFYSNPDALASAVQNGEVDAAERVQPAVAGKLRSGGLVVQTPNSFNELFLSINASKNAAHKELLNPLVREALDLAADRDRIVKTAYYGFASPGSSFVPPSIPDGHLNIAPTPFDLAKANALLDQAGYKRGSDGIRVANGHPMSYDMVVLKDPGGPADATLAILTQDYKKIGVKLNGRVLDVAAAVPAIFGSPSKPYTFDLALLTASGTADPTAILSFEQCSAQGASNFAGYCNPAYDALYTKTNSETDPAARRALIDQLQQTLFNDRAMLALAYAKDAYVHSSAWTGMPTGPGGWFQTLEAGLQAEKK